MNCNPDGSLKDCIEQLMLDSEGKIITKKYSLGPLLGRGGFAKVHEIKDLQSGLQYAAKIIRKKSLKGKAREKIVNEIKIHKQLHHENIVRFESYFEDMHNVYMLLSYCQNETLTDLIKRRRRLHELEVKCYTRQIIEGLKYLLAARVIHRDLKLNNIFIDDKMQVKIGDFGLSTQLERKGQKKKTICGTPNYIAPEVLDNKRGYSHEIDVWALGVIIYTLLFGRPPFQAETAQETYARIRNNSYEFPTNVYVNPMAIDLISRILVPEAEVRLDIFEVENHPFLNGPGIIPVTLSHACLTRAPSDDYIVRHEKVDPYQIKDLIVSDCLAI